MDLGDGAAAPEGFRAVYENERFEDMIGPILFRDRDGERVGGFRAEAKHANGWGFVHGGMLTAFLDGLMGAAVYRSARQTAVTIHLSVDFLHMARVGEWVMGEARVTRATRDVAFVEARAHANGVDVVRGSGVFKLMRRHG